MAVAIGRDLKLALENSSFSMWDSVEGFRMFEMSTNIQSENWTEISLVLRSISGREKGMSVNWEFDIKSQTSKYLKEKLGGEIIGMLRLDLVVPTDVVKYVCENAAKMGCKCDIAVESPTYTFENLSSLVERERIEFPRPTLFGEPIEWPKSMSAVKSSYQTKKKKQLIMKAIPKKQFGKRRIRIE